MGESGGMGSGCQDVAIARPPGVGNALKQLELSKPKLEKLERKVQEMEKIREKAWNTKNLPSRVCTDAIAAGSAGALVAPLIAMIDRAIIENASGRNTLVGSLKTSFSRLIFQPHRFLFSKPFALVLTLYSGTYFAANSVDTISSTLRDQRPDKVTSGPAKFGATSATNLTLCLYKDSKFTQFFGAQSTPRPVPAPTYALYAMRDCLTIFASFNLPPILAPHIPVNLVPAFERHVSSASAAQFIAPAAMQIFSTPLHLLGLDLYNRSRATWGQRWAKVRAEWGMSTLARMGRIIPAFGVGGIVNAGVRRKLMAPLA